MNIKLRLKTEKITANIELLKKLNDVVNNLVQYNTVMPEKKLDDENLNKKRRCLVAS